MSKPTRRESRTPTGALTSAGRVRVGDAVLTDGSFALITRVRRAQGRKPKSGENLHLVADDVIIKVNSLAPVRIRRV